VARFGSANYLGFDDRKGEVAARVRVMRRLRED